MSLKPRHYPRVEALVRRDRSDSGGHVLEQISPQKLAGHLLVTATAAAVKPLAPSLIGSAVGDIRRLLLTIPAYATADAVMAAAYESLLGQLPSTTELVLLVQKSAQPVVEQWVAQYGFGSRSRLDTFDDELNISVWAEDGYVVATDAASGNTYFVEPYAFPRYADGLVADFVTAFTDLRSTQAPLYFQGGNVLVGDDFFFIGADYPAHSLAYIGSHVLAPPPGTSPQQFIHDQYVHYLDHGRRLLYVGSALPVPVEQRRTTTIDGQAWKETICAGNAKDTVQPLFHIDMFVTLVGRGAPDRKFTVLVGDPTQAYAILGGKTPAHAMSPVFDDIAARLAAQGFDVIRNPLPLVYMDDLDARERFWYFATANNALVQDGTTREVWLPTYGHGAWAELQATDAANRALWEGLGFTVHLLGDFHPFAENLGAVHCIKKYLARGA